MIFIGKFKHFSNAIKHYTSPVLEQVFVYQVENASANDIKQALEQIVQESQKEQEKNGKSVRNQSSQQPQPPPRPQFGGLLSRKNQQQNLRKNQRLNLERIRKGAVDAGITDREIPEEEINTTPHPFP